MSRSSAPVSYGKNEYLGRILQLEPGDLVWVPGFPSTVEPAPGPVIPGTQPEDDAQQPEDDAHGLILSFPLSAYAPAPSGHLKRKEETHGRVLFILIEALSAQILRLRAQVDSRPTTPTADSTAEISPMLEIDPELTPLSLTAAEPSPKVGTVAKSNPLGDPHALRILDAGGTQRALFRRNLPETRAWSELLPDPEPLLDAQLYPDGITPVRIFGWDHFAPGWFDALPLAFVEREGRLIRSAVSVASEAGEHMVGTGERFLESDLSGRTLELVNVDALGVNSTRAYKNVPFFISSRGYGIFAHSSYPVTLSLKGVSTRSSQLAVASDRLDLFLCGGGAPEPILRNYRRITGFPPELPIWSYGTWMSRMTYFSAEEVRGIAERLRDERIPCDVLHLDTGWFAKDWVCEWEFSRERFPDPAGFMADLRARGFRTSLWQTPGLGAGNRLLSEAMEKGYLPVPTETTAGSGSDFAVEAVEGQIDFSNPEAEAWYRRLIGHLFDQGASVIKTDFGEEIRMDVSYAGMSAAELRNLYAVLYQRAAFRETAGRTGEAVIWARAGWAGAQRYPVHWGGDAAASWEGMAGTLRGGLHIGLSGFGFWSHDVPGFHGVPHFMNSKPDEELYLRWTQFGVLSSHLRYHGTWPREPWHFPGVFASVREWLELRYALIPYLLEQAAVTARTGMPMLRALPLQFPDDPVAWNIDSQYLLGSDLLVAPLLQPGGRRDVYLPSGRWHDFFTGEILVGPRWIRGRVWPPARLPLYLRSDAELPLYPEAVQCTDEMDLTRTVRIRVDADFDGIASTPVGSYIDL